MATEKQFGEALKEIMQKGKVTYEKLSVLSGVSRTYLTQIIVHAKIPSKEIIKKIANAIKTNPNYFKEYRIINIVEKIELMHWALTSKEIKKIENILENVNTDIPDDVTINIGKLKGGKEVEYTPSKILDITDLNEDQKGIIKNTYNEFKKINKEKEVESDIMESFHNEFVNSDEFGAIVEAHSHDDWITIYSIAYQEYKEKYLKKIEKYKRDKKQ